MLPAIILMMAVQFYVNSAYKKWSRVPARSRMTGAQAAERLIQRGGLYQVSVEVRGEPMDTTNDPYQLAALPDDICETAAAFWRTCGPVAYMPPAQPAAR